MAQMQVGPKCPTPFSVTPTINTSQYAAGDTLGDLMTLTRAGQEANITTILESIVVVDKAGQSSNIVFWFFNSSVTLAANNATFSLSDADALKCVGLARISSGQYASYSNGSVGSVPASQLGVHLYSTADNGPIYVAAQVGSGSTPTYGSTSDLVFTFNFVQAMQG